MFESFEEAEKNRGFKGFLARHFGPVVDADATREGIREIGIVLMCIAALSAGLSFAIRGNAVSLVVGLILVLPACALYLTRSRVAALVLLALYVLNALAALPALLPWVWVLFSVRAIQLTFGYRRLMKEKRETEAALSALE